MFRFSEDYVLNIEKFGGLLLARGGTPAWELDSSHTAFLKTLELSADFELAQRAPQVILGNAKFRPDLDVLQGLGVLEHGKGRPVRDPDPTLRWVADEFRSAKRRSGLRAPTLLTVYPDLFCQQRCSFCFLTQSSKGRHSLSESTHEQPEKWIDLISEAKELGVAGISMLGGEPTLYPGLAQIIEACNTMGMSLGITSNGLRMPEPVLDQIQNSDTTMFCFSLESLDSELHKRFTGVHNRVVLDRMAELSAHGIPFNVNTVGLGQSLDDLKAIADRCVEYGARVWFLNLYYSKARPVPRDFPGYDWYEEMDAQLKEYVKEKHGSNLQYQMFGCQLYWTYPESALEKTSWATKYNELIAGCAAGINQLEVLPDGTTLPCMQMDLDSYACGNVFEEGLAEVWNSAPVLQRLREKLQPENDACSGCDFRTRCRGGCPERRRVTREATGVDVDHLCPNLPVEVRNKVMA